MSWHYTHYYVDKDIVNHHINRMSGRAMVSRAKLKTVAWIMSRSQHSFKVSETLLAERLGIKDTVLGGILVELGCPRTVTLVPQGKLPAAMNERSPSKWSVFWSRMKKILSFR